MAVPGHGACRRDLRTYAYNGDGLLQTRTGGVGATFLWDPATSPSRELKQGNDNIIYGLGPLYVVKGDTTTLIFARDGSKSVRAEINSSGAVTASFRYRAYGQLAQSSSTGPTYLGLASQLLDPSGLYYMRARWYDPQNGRFLSRDPLKSDASAPASLNSFMYGAANPLLMGDASGLAYRELDAGACEDDACGFAPSAGSNWAYDIANVFRDLDSSDLGTQAVALAKISVAGIAFAVPAGLAATPLIVGGSGAAAGSGATGGAVVWGSQHAENAAAAINVTLADAQNVIASGVPYWDIAYRNIAIFAARGSGTLQVAIKEIQRDGTFVIENVIKREQTLDQIPWFQIHDLQRFIPFQ